jgi:hypothetical protein
VLLFLYYSNERLIYSRPVKYKYQQKTVQSFLRGKDPMVSWSADPRVTVQEVRAEYIRILYKKKEG